MKKRPNQKRKTTIKKKVNRSSSKSRVRFLPAILIAGLASFLLLQPYITLIGKDKGVLAYATNTSAAGLLNSTNAERTAHGVASLSLNSKLNAAATAKANDMVARNYWSHQTPDGQQPWVFITNAGYQYLSAGENLAYGFSSSSATVTGWMNSPPHKANLLSSSFTEVGFGMANSPNFVGNGEQTVVVAMYGKPQQAAPAPAPAPEPTPQAQPVVKSTKPQSSPKSSEPAPEPELTEETDKSEDSEAAEEDSEKDKSLEVIAVAEAGNNPTAGSAEVQRIHILTGGSAIWSATLVVLAVCAIGLLWLLHRGFRFKQWIKSSEKLIGKHIHLDLTVLSIVYLGFVLLASSGTIK